MANIVLVGIQWGDEGKAKIIDFLAEHSDIVVRFQGGNNAGHTIVVGDEKTILHLIPSGILHNKTVNVVGNGVVLDMEVFLLEKEKLENKGIDVSPNRLKVSEICHVILPYHRLLDRARESLKSRIGTTGRGIGPTYGDKVMRIGVRIGEFAQPEELKARLVATYQEKFGQLKELGCTEIPAFEEIFSKSLSLYEKIQPHLIDTSRYLNEQVKLKKSILFEGAQGTLLDIDYGTYPYVTSSNTTAAFAACGSGLGPSSLNYVLGLTKAYTTRVGAGPFPTELLGAEEEMGHLIATRGNEFGSTTGRARRCGWLDLVALKRGVELNGVSGLALSKMDILSGLAKVKLAVAYDLNGEQSLQFPNFWNRPVKPIYEELEGWPELKATNRDADLPAPAKRFIERIEEYTGVPVVMISTGAARNQMIIRDSRLRIGI